MVSVEKKFHVASQERNSTCKEGSAAGEEGNQKTRPWLLGISAMVFLFLVWCAGTEWNAHYQPHYPKLNIEGYFQQEQLSEQDYEILFQQTGLAQAAVDKLFQEGRQQELLQLQENLFREVRITCDSNTIISREERCRENYIPYVEEGDILITFNSHVCGWRNGHAAIVVDAGERQTLEARVLGMDSVIMSLEHWEKYPAFAVLRLKNATEEERREIAAYAKENLVGIPYHLTAGWQEGNGETLLGKTPAGTHCSHLVWYAYKQYGYDLDNDGGKIVTPKDLFECDLLEPVQVYGMDILEFQP